MAYPIPPRRVPALPLGPPTAPPPPVRVVPSAPAGPAAQAAGGPAVSVRGRQRVVSERERAQAEAEARTGDVSVTVLNALDGKPLSGVTVRIGKRSARTNADGVATIEGLEPTEKATLVGDKGILWHATNAQVRVAPRSVTTVTLRLHPFTFLQNNWKKLLGGVAIGVAILLGLVAFGPEISPYLAVTGTTIVGGRIGYALLVSSANTVDAVYRGERGWMEDVWSPLLVWVLLLGGIPAIWQGGWIRNWFIETVTVVTTNQYLNAWLMTSAPVLFMSGFAGYALLRAVTIQRLQRQLELVPLLAALGVPLALYLNPLNGIGEVATGFKYGVLTLFVLALFVDAWRKPKDAFVGVVVAVVVLSMGPVLTYYGLEKYALLSTTLLLAGLTVWVLFDAVNRQRQILDRDPQKAANVPAQVRTGILHWALHAIYFGGLLLPTLLKIRG